MKKPKYKPSRNNAGLVVKCGKRTIEFSNELIDDLKSIHGINPEQELANIIAAEFIATRNRYEREHRSEKITIDY